MTKPGLETRRVALEALLQSDYGHFVGEWIAGHGQDLSPADRGLALEIALTTLRWKRFLDHQLEPRLQRWPGDRAVWILRMALAQIWRLDRIPHHAAVDIAVDLSHELDGPRMAGLVNAVLRGCLRTGPLVPEGDDPLTLSIRHSHPEWLVKRWCTRLGAERTAQWLVADNLTPPLWVRPNPRWSGELPWTEEQILSRVLDGAFARLDASRQELLASSAFAEGAFSFQDPASGRAALALAPYIPAGGTFLDLCCAPGGKTAMLAEAGYLDGVKTFACDLSHERQLRTLEGFSRLKDMAGIATLCADGLQPPFQPESFDAILLDAPCSNLGVLARRPEARWRLAPADLATQSGLQLALLESALRLLKPGGVLAYSTCTVEPEETTNLVYPLKKSGACEFIDLSGLESPEPSPSPLLCVHPGTHGWDGFFTALLRKPLT